MTFKPMMETTQFEDLVCTGKMSRRQAHRVMASYGIGSVVVPALSSAAVASPEDQPMMFTWGGYDSPEFMVHYVEKYGEPPRYAFFGDEDEAFAKMRGGFKPDVTYPCGPSLKLWYDAGFLAPIETDRLSNWPDVMQVFKNVPDSVVDGQRIYVPEDWGQTSMVIRTDLAPEYTDPENQTWKALWNEKYSGQLSISRVSYEAFAIAALVLGIEPWHMNEAERIQCEDILREQIPLNRTIGASATERAQMLASGELIIGTGDNGLAARLSQYAEETGIEFTWTKPKEGALTWHCGLCIHPAALEDGMYDKCHDLINSMISPEAGAFEISNWNIGHSNVKSYEGFSEEFLRSIGLTKHVEEFLANAQFQQAMNEPEVLSTRWEELQAGF